MAKIVHITFFSDSLEGSRHVQLGNHVCQLYDLMREDERAFKTLSSDLDTPALYVLLNRKLGQAYIGQTDCFIQRISQHMAKKDFWDEVLVFIASDHSISATEVQYLEATAYDHAKEAGSFDLSANSQKPKVHNISQLAKYNSLDFFKVVCDLSKIVGCNIFEHGPQKNPQNKTTLEPVLIHNVCVDTIQGTGVKLFLNGNGPYNKGRFAFEVVREYIKEYPNVTIDQLKEIFPNSLLGNWGRWNLIETDIESAMNLSENGKGSRLRHFVSSDCILQSPKDGTRFVVSSQWDYRNLPNLLSLVKSFGWSFEIKKKPK